MAPLLRQAETLRCVRYDVGMPIAYLSGDRPRALLQGAAGVLTGEVRVGSWLTFPAWTRLSERGRMSLSTHPSMPRPPHAKGHHTLTDVHFRIHE
jgi:hypothetical protein